MATTTSQPKPLLPVSGIYAAALGLLVILGTAERIYGIDHQSLWSDELFAVMVSHVKSFWNIWPFLLGDSHPPGYALFMYFTLPLTGYSDIGIRLHALIFGVLWLPLTYVLCRRWFSANTALLATGMLTSASAAIYFSQEARAYTILVALIIANTHYLLGALLEPTPQARDRRGFIITSTLALYFHYTGFVLYSSQVLLYMVLILSRSKRCSLKEAAWLFLPPLLWYSPWFVVMLKQIINGHSEWAVSAPPTGNDVYYLLQRLLGPDKNHFILHLSLLAITTCLLGIAFWRHRFTGSHRALLCIIFLGAVPILAFYIKSLIGTPIFEKRYFLHAVPFICITSAFAINQMASRISNGSGKLLLIICLLGAYSFWTINENRIAGLYSSNDKDPVRETAEAIAHDIEINQYVKNYTVLMTHNWFEHYLGQKRIRYDASWPYHLYYIPQQIRFVQDYLSGHQKIEVFYYAALYEERARYATAALKAQYKLLSETTLNSSTPYPIHIYKFSAKENAEESQLALLDSGPTNNAIAAIAKEVTGKDPASYTVVMTHDWFEAYLQRNKISYDKNWDGLHFYSEWHTSELKSYLDQHSAVDTLYYIAVREPGNELASNLLRASYLLRHKSTAETSVGKIDIYNFDSRKPPAAEELATISFTNNPLADAIAAIHQESETANSANYRVLLSDYWLQPYLIRNHLQGENQLLYNDAQAEETITDLKNHPEARTLYYIARQDKSVTDVANLLQIEYRLVYKKSFTSTSGPVNIYKFDTGSRGDNSAALREEVSQTPIGGLVKWLASDATGLHAANTILVSHDWFDPYLRLNNIPYEAGWHSRFYNNSSHLGDVTRHVQANPAVQKLYYLRFATADMQPALDALIAQYQLECTRSVTSTVGTLEILRFNTTTPGSQQTDITPCPD